MPCSFWLLRDGHKRALHYKADVNDFRRCKRLLMNVWVWCWLQIQQGAAPEAEQTLNSKGQLLRRAVCNQTAFKWIPNEEIKFVSAMYKGFPWTSQTCLSTVIGPAPWTGSPTWITEVTHRISCSTLFLFLFLFSPRNKCCTALLPLTPSVLNQQCFAARRASWYRHWNRKDEHLHIHLNAMD